MAKVSDAHLEARRQSILDAASRVFSRKGVELATMAEVAAEAGISPGAIYRYFENKDELALGCMNLSRDAIEAQWEQPEYNSDDPMGEFMRLAQVTLAELNKPAEVLDTMLGLERMMLLAREGAEAPDVPTVQFDKIVGAISGRLKNAQEVGQLPKDFDTNALAGALYSFYWGARITRMVKPGADTDAQFNAIASLLAHACTVPA